MQNGHTACPSHVEEHVCVGPRVGIFSELILIFNYANMCKSIFGTERPNKKQIKVASVRNKPQSGVLCV
jgi:hypothetical protein